MERWKCGHWKHLVQPIFFKKFSPLNLTMLLARAKTYEAIVKGDNLPTPGIPESFNVLLHELRGLGLKITLD